MRQAPPPLKDVKPGVRSGLRQTMCGTGSFLLCPSGLRSDAQRSKGLDHVHNNTTYTAMPRKKKALILAQPVREGIERIKVRLDARTVITLANLKALEFWKQRYPKAEVIG